MISHCKLSCACFPVPLIAVVHVEIGALRNQSPLPANSPGLVLTASTSGVPLGHRPTICRPCPCIANIEALPVPSWTSAASVSYRELRNWPWETATQPEAVHMSSAYIPLGVSASLVSLLYKIADVLSPRDTSQDRSTTYSRF